MCVCTVNVHIRGLKLLADISSVSANVEVLLQWSMQDTHRHIRGTDWCTCVRCNNSVSVSVTTCLELKEHRTAKEVPDNRNEGKRLPGRTQKPWTFCTWRGRRMKNSGPPMPTGSEKSPSNTRARTCVHKTQFLMPPTHTLVRKWYRCVPVCVWMRHTLEHAGYNTYTSCKRIKHQKKTFIKASERGCQRFFLKMKERDILSFRLISPSLSLSKSLKYHPCFYDEERARKREKGG